MSSQSNALNTMASDQKNTTKKVMSLFTERRLPWRMSQWLERRRQEALRRRYDKLALRTRPFVTGEDAPHFEVHVLLGHRHVGMTLWCVKSFLYQCGRKYSVVLHEDGTLTEQDIAHLQRHLVNVRIVLRSEADPHIMEQIGHLPNCREYRFLPMETTDHRGVKYNMHIFALRLFDFNLLSQAKKTLVLDCDVLFFGPPREIMAWADNEENVGCLYSIEQYIPKRNARYEVIGYERKDPQPKDANAGLLCLDKRYYDLDALEGWIGRNHDLMDKVATFEQRAYNHLIQRSSVHATLPDSYSFNYTDQDVVATHFAIKHLFFGNLPRLLKVLA